MERTGAEIAALLDGAVAARVFSGYQFVSWRGGRTVERFGGKTSYWPDARAVTAETLFDIGSVTKTVATTTLVALAVAAGRARLDDPLGRHVKALGGTPLGELRLDHLLAHAAGVEWWYPFYETLGEGSREKLLPWLIQHGATLRVRAPVEATVYSDPGFILLGLAVENWWGDLRSAFSEKIAKPLGLSSITFGPVTGRPVAATEYCLWRKRLLAGEVFDENCFALGGAMGHAGLFSTARDLARIGVEWMKADSVGSAWLPTEVASRFVGPACLVAGSHWRFGWDGKAAHGSSAGEFFSPQSFGGLGYPGASLWIDPELKGVVVLLTNRVHPSRVDERIRTVRPRVHDAVARAWMKEGE